MAKGMEAAAVYKNERRDKRERAASMRQRLWVGKGRGGQRTIMLAQIASHQYNI